MTVKSHYALVTVLVVAGVAVAVAGVVAVGLQGPDAEVTSFTVTNATSDDGKTENETVEQVPVEGGTKIVVENTFLAASPSRGLEHELERTTSSTSSPAEYVLSIESVPNVDSGSENVSRFAYEATVFVPEETDYKLTVVHDGARNTVIATTPGGSSGESSSSEAPSNSSG